MHYIMLINGNETDWDTVTPDEVDAATIEVYAWFDRWGKAGKLASGGQQLDRSSKAKTLRRDGEGKVVVTDGPYAELKEIIGGFVTLDTESLAEAVDVASTWPGLHHTTSIEVRPVITHEEPA